MTDDQKVIKALTHALSRYMSYQRIHHLKRIARGLCKRCSKPRVTALWCREHADAWNDYQKNGSKEERCK